MKKLLIILLSLAVIPLAQAAETANIKIKMAGAIHNNRYFLCLRNVGCLSILGAKKGKIYPLFHSIEMGSIFITDTTNFRVYNQGLPNSCRLTVKPNQTITIQGNLIEEANKGVRVSQLRCALS